MANINHKDLTHDDWHDNDTLTDQETNATKVEVRQGDSETNTIHFTIDSNDAGEITDDGTDTTHTVDIINENHTGRGVTIEGVKIDSNVITGATSLTVTTIQAGVVMSATPAYAPTSEAIATLQYVEDNSFPAGNDILFYEATLPSGWTEATNTATSQECMLRVVDVGAGTGGNAATGTDVVTDWDNHDHTVQNHSHASGTLATASHNHQWHINNGDTTTAESYTLNGSETDLSRGTGASNYRYFLGIEHVTDDTTNFCNKDLYTSNKAASISGSTTSDGTHSTSGSNFDPKYIDVVIGHR